mmetsp:Transcript_96649/g.224078  ORF Transcript_96649/g.224078 Transcript_96649/m.224078 type:complete len:829 (-) Transcript_96649:132-2618(-)
MSSPLAAKRTSGGGDSTFQVGKRSSGSGENNSFQAALFHLGELHRRELAVLRQELEQQLACLHRENNALRARLGEAGLSPSHIHFHPDVDTSPCRDKQGSKEPSNYCDLQCPPSPKADRQLAMSHSLSQDTRVALKKSGSFRWPSEQTVYEVKEAWNKIVETSPSCWTTSFGFFMDERTDEFPRKKHSSLMRSVKRRSAVASAAADVTQRSEMDVKAGDLEHFPLCGQRGNTSCVIYPHSRFRFSWDISGLCLISYDLISIPFNQAFDPPDTWFSIGMDWITLLFWTGDMVQGFFLGYFEKGCLVLDHSRILRHYLITWFVLDAIVVGPEWFMTVASSTAENGEQAGEMAKILKGARAVRVLRLLRLLKLQRIINFLYDRIESEHTFICVNLAKLLVAVLVLNHVIACIWFLIGRICMENNLRNWIEVGEVTEETLSYKYTTSLHWSLTQFTPASMEISARNVFERAFSIVVLFFAMVAFSSIVASITGSMTSLRNMRAEEMKQGWLLRRYLRQREVTGDLTDRIFKYLEHQSLKQGTQVQTGSLKATLPKLSLALQSELQHELNSPFLTIHAFFGYLDRCMCVVMHRLCQLCLTPQSHAEKEVIFSAGEKASKMFFIKPMRESGGKLQYQSGDKMLDPPPSCNDWVSEAILWTDWRRHMGQLTSVSANDLIALDPVQFVEVMCMHPRSWFYAKAYAAMFVDHVNSLAPGEVTDILRWPGAQDEREVQECDPQDSWKEGEAVNSGSVADFIELHEGAELDPPVDEGDESFNEVAGSSPRASPPHSPRLRTRFSGLGAWRWDGVRRTCPWVAKAVVSCEPWCSAVVERR